MKMEGNLKSARSRAQRCISEEEGILVGEGRMKGDAG